MQTAISYVRVSTEKQGRSGLGIEAQRGAIARFADTEGFDLIDEFVEVETGKGSDALDRRPELAAALSAARKAERSYGRKLVTGFSGGVLDLLDPVLERHSLTDLGEVV